MRHFVLVFTALFIAFAGSAQIAPQIRNFSPESYRGQNQNWALAQSKAGWIYAGNNGGLLEFDGARWLQYTLPEKQTVRAVAAGPGQRIFCGGFAEFGYWQPDEFGQLRYHSLSKNLRSDRLFKEEIWHILATEQFVLFQSFSTIYKYDFEKVTILQPPNSIMFARAVQGRVLVPVIERGLYELLPDNSFRFVNGSEPLADKIVQFLIPGSNGTLWAGTTNHGIFELENDRCRPWPSPLNSIFTKQQLNKALALRQGGWAFGTILGGLYLLDERGQLRYHLNRENGLQNNTVLALAEDREGQLWAGLDRGLDLILLQSPLTFFTDLSGKTGAVYSAAKWNGNLYIGTNQGVFKQTPSGFQLLDGTQGQVWQLGVFGGQLLCGHNAGTFLIQDAAVRSISSVTGGWCTLPVPGRPDLLLQSSYTGLLVFRRRPGKSNWELAHRIQGFTEPLKKIVFDPSGTLWGAHPNKGLYRLRLSPDLQRVQEYRLFTREDGLPSDFALSLEVVLGKPVLNTLFSPMEIVDSAGRHHFRALTNLPQRQRWLPGADGDYFSVDSIGLRWHPAGRPPLPLPLTLIPGYEHVAPLGTGAYLFCLENGFALLDKSRMLAQNDHPPPVRIRRIEASDGTAIPLNDPVRLDHRLNSWRVGFACPAFALPPLFSWRIDGWTSDWSPWQHHPEKEINPLPPGRYLLRVRANTGGAEAQLQLVVPTPWYRSAWALAGYCILLLAGIFLLEKISQRRLERQRRHLEADKARELARQRDDSEREKLTLEVANKTRELSNAALSLIRKNEVLQRLRDELLQAGNDPPAPSKNLRATSTATSRPITTGKYLRPRSIRCTTIFSSACCRISLSSPLATCAWRPT